MSAVVDELGFEIVKWNVETDDYDRRDHTKWIPKGIDGIKAKGDKCVVINHDIHESSAGRHMVQQLAYRSGIPPLITVWLPPYCTNLYSPPTSEECGKGGSERGTRTPDPRIMIPVL